jgi:hypothetical protein
MPNVFPLLRTCEEIEDLVGSIEGEISRCTHVDEALRLRKHLGQLSQTVMEAENKAGKRAERLAGEMSR